MVAPLHEQFPFVCAGHRDGADGLWRVDLAMAEDCIRDSPFDTPDLDLRGNGPSGWVPGTPDEASWYRRGFSSAIRWAITHPNEELGLTLRKAYDTVEGDSKGGLNAAQHFGVRSIASPFTTSVLDRLANVWHWAMLAFAAVALWRLPSVRSAWLCGACRSSCW